MVYNLTDDSIGSFEVHNNTTRTPRLQSCCYNQSHPNSLRLSQIQPRRDKASVQAAIKQAIRKKEKARGADEQVVDDDGASHKYILIGLHTCGDLAHKVPSSVLRPPLP